jgi:uncharacterized protein (TIGR00369 family)
VTEADAAHGEGHEPDPRLIELWETADAAEFLRAVGEGRAPRSPHQEHVGLRIADAEPGSVELEWLPKAHICNRAGIVHGGYLAIVLDDAAGLAAASLGDRFIPMLTMDLRIEYLRPALPDRPYRAIGTIVHAGRTRLVADGRVEDADGTLLARASGSFTPNRTFMPDRMAQ